MSIEEVYASALAGNENVIIHALVIDNPGREPVRFCDGFRDRMLGVDGVAYEFKCGSIELSLPAKNTSGQQSLRFAVPNLTGEIRQHINASLNAGQSVYMTYLEYLAGDPMTPISRPIRMHINGASIEGIAAIFQGSYKNLLSLAFGDKNRYTSASAPGIRFSQ